MKMILRKSLQFIQFLFLGIFIESCEMIEYHPYDLNTKNQPSNLNETNISRIEAATNASDTIRFVFMGDTQRFYDETKDFVNNVNKRNDIDFVIHGGDITDFGMSKEFTWIHDILKKLKVPYVAVVGNHDIIGNGKEVYQKIYGDYNFSFQFRKTRFICLNTNALEFDYSTPVPDYNFMMGFLNDTSYIERTIVVMHSPPFDDQFNNNSSMMFNYLLGQYKNLKFCLHAHKHSLSVNDYFNNGILYYGCDDISGRSYLLFTLVGDSYSYSIVNF